MRKVHHSKKKTRRVIVNDVRLLYRCCSMWSKDPNAKNIELAHRLGINEKNVTDLLRKAKRLKLIHRVFSPPLEVRLQDQLALCFKRYGVGAINVVAGGADGEGVGHRAARFFEGQCADEDGIVLDGGKTVGEFVAAVRALHSEKLTLSPIAADPLSYRTAAFEWTFRLASKCMAEVNRLPSWTDGELGPAIQISKSIARQARFVFLGVGPWASGYTALEFVEHLGLDKKEIVKRYGARVAAAVGYCAITSKGQAVEIEEVDARMPRALKLNDLKNMAAARNRFVVLLAHGADKANAIWAAARARCFNTLIIDNDLAAALMQSTL